MTAFKSELDEKHFRVAIFGSARITEEDPIHRLIHNLAKLIAAEGMDVVTGGGPGLMNAAAKGHQAGRNDPSQHSIGLNIRLPFEQAPSTHLDIKEDFSHFSSRLDHFMVLANVAVVAPGGIGTLLEFFYTWQLMQVKHICNIPIILLGEMWPGLVQWIRKWPLEKGLLDQEDLELVYVTKNCKEAFDIIQNAYEDFLQGGENFCLNFHAYKLT